MLNHARIKNEYIIEIANIHERQKSFAARGVGLISNKFYDGHVTIYFYLVNCRGTV